MKKYSKPFICGELGANEVPMAAAAPIAVGAGFLLGLSGDDVYHPEHMYSLVERKMYKKGGV